MDDGQIGIRKDPLPKVCNDIKKYVMTRKSKSWRQNYDITSTIMSSSKKVHIQVKNYIRCAKVTSWHQKVHQDVKVTLWSQRFVIMWKIHHDVKNLFMTSKSTPWRQRFFMASQSSETTSWRHTVIHDVTNSSWHQEVHHYVDKYVMTSMLYHDINNTSWLQKVRHDIKKFVMTYFLTSKLYNDIKNSSWGNIYDVKMYVMMLKSVWRHKVRYETSIRHDVQNTAWHQSQKVRHDAKSSSWRQKYTMMSKSSQWHQNVRWDIKNASW